MNCFLEFKKIKRTGLLLAFVLGGLLAAAIPILRLILSDQNLPNVEPMEKLLTENWQMLAMLNSFLIITGACLLYSIEYSEHALEKMKTLPIKESSLFFNKALLLAFLSTIVLFLEMIAIIVATYQWFDFYENFGIGLMKNFGYLFFMHLPAVFLALVIASLFENIWVSLGINVTAVLFSDYDLSKKLRTFLISICFTFSNII